MREKRKRKAKKMRKSVTGNGKKNQGNLGALIRASFLKKRATNRQGRELERKAKKGEKFEERGAAKNSYFQREKSGKSLQRRKDRKGLSNAVTKVREIPKA